MGKSKNNLKSQLLTYSSNCVLQLLLRLCSSSAVIMFATRSTILSTSKKYVGNEVKSENEISINEICLEVSLMVMTIKRTMTVWGLICISVMPYLLKQHKTVSITEMKLVKELRTITVVLGQAYPARLYY